ncbi:MAG: hypothetical protein CVV41_05275 [Candidatus Riflebacteria bacterium HGW-Riflebacteria-1]|nr:MAG: hypothetical protein CVV41_05275 [Candidatus Riflebacteria bacterium HGW-Riflebacteria-1]
MDYFSNKPGMIIIQALLRRVIHRLKDYRRLFRNSYIFSCSYPDTICANHPVASPRGDLLMRDQRESA